MTRKGREIRLASRPTGTPTPDNFALAEVDVPEPADGEVVVRNLVMSVDPYMRGRMNDVKSYVPPVQIGEVMRAGGVGEVLESRHPGFQKGDHVYGTIGIQEYATVDGKGLTKVDARIAPLPVYLGTLGMPGMTAYFGLLDVGKPQPGQTVVVSGAAGAVGMVVGQIAKMRGCRVVGICSSPEKQKWLTSELGFDAAVSHRDDSFRNALREACPDGVDVYFDNVGGTTLDTVLGSMAYRGRVVCCGVVSQYDTTNPVRGARGVPGVLIVKSITMRGFLVMSDFADRYAEGLAALEGWLDDGSLTVREDILEGLDKAPEGLVGVLNGTNIGKRMSHVADPS